MVMTWLKIGLMLGTFTTGVLWAAHPALLEKPTAEKSLPAGPKEERAKSAHLDYYGDPLPPGALARLGSIQLRSQNYHSSLAYSPDGKTLIAVGYADLKAYFWDVATGRQIKATKCPVWADALTQDGRVGANWRPSAHPTAATSPPPPPPRSSGRSGMQAPDARYPSSRCRVCRKKVSSSSFVGTWGR